MTLETKDKGYNAYMGNEPHKLLNGYNFMVSSPFIMKRILIILLFPFVLNAQFKDYWRAIPDDVKHHYAACFTAVGTGIAVKKIFKANNFVCGISGTAAGIGITLLKENWWDGKLGRGVKSNEDKANGFWGAGCGGFYVGVGYTIKESNQNYIDTLNYQYLNKIKRDSL